MASKRQPLNLLGKFSLRPRAPPSSSLWTLWIHPVGPHWLLILEPPLISSNGGPTVLNGIGTRPMHDYAISCVPVFVCVPCLSTGSHGHLSSVTHFISFRFFTSFELRRRRRRLGRASRASAKIMLRIINHQADRGAAHGVVVCSFPVCLLFLLHISGFGEERVLADKASC